MTAGGCCARPTPRRCWLARAEARDEAGLDRLKAALTEQLEASGLAAHRISRARTRGTDDSAASGPARDAGGRGRHARPCCSTWTRSSTTWTGWRRCWRPTGATRLAGPRQDAQVPGDRRCQQMRRGAVGQCVQKVGGGRGAGLGRGIRTSWSANEVVGAGQAGAVRGAGRGSQRWRSVPTTRAGVAQTGGGGRGPRGTRLSVLVEIDVGMVRAGRAAGAGGGGAGAKRIAGSRAPAFRRPAGVSRQRAAFPHAGGTAGGDRRCLGRDAAHDGTAAATRAGVPRSIGGAGTGTFEIEAASGRLHGDPGRQLLTSWMRITRATTHGGSVRGGSRHALVRAVDGDRARRGPGLGVLDAGHKALSRTTAVFP